MMFSSDVAVAAATSHQYVAHDKGGEDCFEEDLRLTEFSFKLPFLESFLGSLHSFLMTLAALS